MAGGGHLIIERVEPGARKNWPPADSALRWLVIYDEDGGSGVETPARLEWMATYAPAPDGRPHVAVVFEEMNGPLLLNGVGADCFKGWRSWLHYGGLIAAADLRRAWAQHPVCRGLTSPRKEYVQGRLGFPLPVADTQTAEWSGTWRRLKRDLTAPGKSVSYERLTTALDTSYNEIEKAALSCVSTTENLFSEIYASDQALDSLAAAPVTPQLIRAVAENIIRITADSADTGPGGTWSAVAVRCRQIIDDQHLGRSEAQVHADALKAAIEAFHTARGVGG